MHRLGRVYGVHGSRRRHGVSAGVGFGRPDPRIRIPAKPALLAAAARSRGGPAAAFPRVPTKASSRDLGQSTSVKSCYGQSTLNVGLTVRIVLAAHLEKRLIQAGKVDPPNRAPTSSVSCSKNRPIAAQPPSPGKSATCAELPLNGWMVEVTGSEHLHDLQIAIHRDKSVCVDFLSIGAGEV